MYRIPFLSYHLASHNPLLLYIYDRLFLKSILLLQEWLETNSGQVGGGINLAGFGDLDSLEIICHYKG